MRLFKKPVVLAIICITASVLLSCSTDSTLETNIPNLDGQWSQSVLAEDTITVLQHVTDRLYAGTTQGIFRRTISANNKRWNSLGLQSKDIVDVVVLGNQKILAGVKLPDLESTQNSLFLTTNGGEKWMPYQQNFGGENHYNWLTDLSRHPENPSILYAKGDALTVAKSTDMGESWQLAYGSWQPQFGFPIFIKIDSENPNIIWTGGRTPTFAPRLVKSTNAGDTWQQVAILENVETGVYDVSVHPSKKNTVIAGLGIGIRKSTDGGQSWTTTFSRAGVYNLTRSARNPEVVYASGQNQDGTLFFAASGDFGDSWQTVTMPDSPTGIQVNDMVSVMEGGQEVLHFGTNKGIYSYTFAE